MDVDGTRVGNVIPINVEVLGMDHNERLDNLEEGAYVTNNGLILGVADVPRLGEEVEMKMGAAGQLHIGSHMMNDDPFLTMHEENGRDFDNVIDIEYTIQVAIANRIDSHDQRAREEDERNGYNKRFAINTGLPVLFNDIIGHGSGLNNEEIILANGQEAEVASNMEHGGRIGEDHEPVIQEADVEMFLNHVNNSQNEVPSKDWLT